MFIRPKKTLAFRKHFSLFSDRLPASIRTSIFVQKGKNNLGHKNYLSPLHTDAIFIFNHFMRATENCFIHNNTPAFQFIQIFCVNLCEAVTINNSTLWRAQCHSRQAKWIFSLKWNKDGVTLIEQQSCKENRGGGGGQEKRAVSNNTFNRIKSWSEVN